MEIVCIGQSEPTDFQHLPFAVQSGTELKSHRTPDPLFQEDFDALRGCIYHLGNPYLKTRKGLFFASELLSDRLYSRPTTLAFRPEFVPGVQDLLKSLVELSPVHQVLFTSDYQFGPKRPYRSAIVTLDEFWSLHNSRKLRFNSAYPIRK